MINRPEYLKKLHQFKDKNVIKVIMGIRRCGKSTIFELFQKDLLKNGVTKDQIQSINFENMDFEHLLNYRALHEHIKSKLVSDKMNYIFLDEIQNVENFQKTVDSLQLLPNIDIYITGSNAHLLSGELATLLSGRYVTISMLPLSFKEYVSSFADSSDLGRKFKDYLVNSSFPYTTELNGSRDLIRDYLSGLYSTIVLKDVMSRSNILNNMILEDVIRFMFKNLGNLSSIKSISDTMTSDGRKISTHTVENYLSALINSYVLYKVGRYDVRGKQYLQSRDKYYVADIGLRYFLLGSRDVDYGQVLENVVYLELLRRGYEIYVGKVGPLEIDFVALKDGEVEYYQVAYTVKNEKTLTRELSSLEAVTDHNRKYLITMDDLPTTFYNGIKQINAIDWLLE
ncbi:MAG: ATP-binding protein [Alphaproteobacteria bacterium]|nr:ATP-binding protein [Alphaproteobacteria bacterium]